MKTCVVVNFNPSRLYIKARLATLTHNKSLTLKTTSAYKIDTFASAKMGDKTWEIPPKVLVFPNS